MPPIPQQKKSFFAEKKVSQNRIFFLTVTAGGGAAPRNSLGFNELRCQELFSHIFCASNLHNNPLAVLHIILHGGDSLLTCLLLIHSVNEQFSELDKDVREKADMKGAEGGGTGHAQRVMQKPTNHKNFFHLFFIFFCVFFLDKL
jgi:hypothetical protein